MGSAATGLPPSREFVRLYHLCRAAHAQSNIRNRRLKIARFSEVNDPFELMSLDFRESRVRTAVKEYRSELNSREGLLCFSEDWTSPMLWSYYAESHRGVCLGFNVKREAVEKVLYEDTRIKAELDDETGSPVALSPGQKDALRCTKCHEWSYEQERRRFVKLVDAQTDAGKYFWPFDPTLQLAEVILGPRCELDLQSLRGEVLQVYPNANVFSARLAWQHFKVVPWETSVP